MSGILRLALFIPHLMRAAIYVGIILAAAPLRLLLSDRPRRGDENDMTNDDLAANVPETTSGSVDDPEVAQLVALHNNLTTALDKAGVPSKVPDGRPVSIGHPLDLVGRVLWLVQELSQAEGRLGELHIELRRTFDADSVSEALEKALALRGADARLKHFVEQRDAEVDELRAGFMRQRDEAAKDRDFFREAAERAAEEARAATGRIEELQTLCDLRGAEIADRDAQIEALTVEVALLDAHVDCIDEALAEHPDLWADWDLQTENEDEETDS